MSNNSERISTPPAGISGDVIILVVFFIIGTILFASFAMGFIVFGQGSATLTPTPSIVSSKPTSTVTPTPSASSTGASTPTLLFPGDTVTPLYTAMPSLTPLVGPKTNTVVAYKSSTPVPYKSPVPPTKTSVPVKTGTRTRTPTTTITATITPTGFTSTPTETMTPTVTGTATETGTPTITPTPTVTPTPTITPAGICATPDSSTGILLDASDDTWIENTIPPTPHATDAHLSIRANNGGDQRILIKFDLPTLLPSSVTTAKLYLHISDGTTTNFPTIFLYRLTNSWAGTDASWLTAKSSVNWLSPGGDYNHAPVISAIATVGCQVQLDVTPLVLEWLNDPTSNNGIILIAYGPNGDFRISSTSGISPVLWVR